MTKQEWKEHIESVLSNIGYFEGNRAVIRKEKTSNLCLGDFRIDDNTTITKLLGNDLEESINEFISIEGYPEFIGEEKDD